MTEEQQQLASDYVASAYKFLKKHNLDFDEFGDIMLESLCKSAIAYEPNHDTSFLTFAWYGYEMALQNYYAYIYRMKRHLNKNIGETMIYLDDYDTSMPISDVPMNVPISEMIGNDDMEISNIDFNNSLNDYIQMLTKVELKVFTLIQNGYNRSEIAKIMKYSRQRNCEVFNSLKKKVVTIKRSRQKEELNECKRLARRRKSNWN